MCEENMPAPIAAIGGLIIRGGGRAAASRMLRKSAKRGNVPMPPARVDLSVKVDIKDAARHLDRMQRKQLPFAIARALTKLAQEAQKEIQQEIPKRFNVTRKWWLKQQPTGIKITPATKQKLESSVYTKAYFAELQEEGGTKRPHKGSRIAVPSDNVKAKKNRRSGAVREQASKPKVFYANTDTGKRAMFRRRTKKPYPIEMLYTFTPTAWVRKRFKFVETAERVVRQRFKRVFEESLRKALRTARR